MVGFFFGGASGIAGYALLRRAMLESASWRKLLRVAWLHRTPPYGHGVLDIHYHSKNPPFGGLSEWWSIGDSNPGLPACKAGALAN